MASIAAGALIAGNTCGGREEADLRCTQVLPPVPKDGGFGSPTIDTYPVAGVTFIHRPYDRDTNGPAALPATPVRTPGENWIVLPTSIDPSQCA